MAGKQQRRERVSTLRECKGVHFDHQSLEGLGAHSMGIGRKHTEDEILDTVCLRFYVAKKRPLADLASREKVPSRMVFYSRREAKEVHVTTDVIEAAPAQFENGIDPTARLRPVPGGANIGIPGRSGTLGGWVFDKTDASIVMLSNAHVLGHEPGLDVLQQSTSHGGATPTDRIGTVKRGIVRSDTEPNRVDCAVGDPVDGDVWSLDVLEVGPGVFATRPPELELSVEKYGQKTRLTFGKITDTDWSGKVSGRPFEDCIRVDPTEPSTDWSEGGDSGSLVFGREADPETEIKPAVGLHFAGASAYGIACTIDNVFQALDLDTLSTGAFATFLDSLFEVETEGEVSEETERRLRHISAFAARRLPRALPPPLASRERLDARSFDFFRGISTDLRARLRDGDRGRKVTELLDRHQAELLQLLSRHGDVRRAIVAALRPLLAGATTTTEALRRVLLPEDVSALASLGRELERFAGDRLKTSLRMVQDLEGRADGRTLGDILDLEV